ncbi:MAG: DUF5717 family protein, partial [bacterium]|nr:DUF5717 family protein [bacterium]
ITPLPRNLNAKISRRLESVIVKAMQVKKEDRFKTIPAMQDALLGNGKAQSNKFCPKCKAIVNINDRFCRNCGSATHPIASSSASSFIFSSQKKVRSIQELVNICYQNWNEAVQHLYNGDIETWLKSQKDGKSFARKVEDIRKNQPDRNLGLHEFLTATGFGIAPQIHSNLRSINFGRIPPGSKKQVLLTISNSSMGYLKGTVQSQAKWIDVSQRTFVCLNQATFGLRVSVDSRFFNRPGFHRDKLNIKSNGGNVIIPVSVMAEKKQSPAAAKIHPAPKASTTNSYGKPIALFLMMAMLIRHLGPRASLTISEPSVVILMSALVGLLHLNYGKLGFFLGSIIGACLGALANIIAFYVFPFINETIMHPVLSYLTPAYSDPISYAGWGMIGIYLGVTFAFFQRKRKKKYC